MEKLEVKTPSLKHEVLRKIVHILLCFLLMLPLTELYTQIVYPLVGLTAIQYYSILTISAAFINAVQIKRPLIKDEIFKTMQLSRKKILDEIKNIVLSRSKKSQKIIVLMEKLDASLTKLETMFYEQISYMERSHERITGYVGMTFGALSVLCAYLLVEEDAFYGVLALMIIDPITAVVSCKTKRKLPYSRTSPYGSLLGFVIFSFVLTIIGVNLTNALILALIGVLVEAYGIEDNISLPIIVSLIARILGV